MAINFSCTIINENAVPIPDVEVFQSSSNSSTGTSTGVKSDSYGNLSVTWSGTGMLRFFHFVKSGYTNRVLALNTSPNATNPYPICIIMRSENAFKGPRASRLQISTYKDWRDNTISQSTCTAKITRAGASSVTLNYYPQGNYYIETINDSSFVVELTLDDGRSTIPLTTYGLTPSVITSANFYTSTQKKYINGNKLPPLKDLFELITPESFK